jgi:Sigma-70, region 4
MSKDTPNSQINLETIVKDILEVIERDREREIISRRFGLFDRKETLEQIGELLGITRERVRQLEKAVVLRLVAMGEKDLPHIHNFEPKIINYLQTTGGVAKISDLCQGLNSEPNKINQSRVAFLAQLSPQITYLDENDHFFASAATLKRYSEKKLKSQVGVVIEKIKQIGKPVSLEELAGALGYTDVEDVRGLASTSKNLANLNNRWGLIKWPMVNPKNIRDKIYVILHDNGKQMHFNEIAKAIRTSEFKRKEVTTQAIHNELIKDGRFVLVGRGIYALKDWGYKKGTVADVITEVLTEAGQPLHRDDIVKRVLKKRFVKETTILLNLQGKAQFKRVAKATYALEG